MHPRKPLKLISNFIIAANVTLFSSFVFSQSNCPAGSFGPNGSFVCTLAPPGFFVPEAGATAPTIAPAGSFVAGSGAISATLAAPGTFVALPGQTFAQISPPGFFVPSSGATAPIISPAGSFVANAGSISATLASPGSYVALPGQTSAILSPPGFFVPNAGAIAPTIAPAGSFVQSAGASEATLASPGSFVAEQGQTSATFASPGFFVAETGATAPTIAPVGFFVADSGAITAIPAAPGFYSPEEGATFTLLCPQDSTSFGAAPACRSGFVSMNNIDTIGPNFDSNFGNDFSAPNLINLDALDINTAGLLEFEILNTANFLGMTNDLTSLSLLNAEFSGVNADLFSLDGFMPGMVLGEQQNTTFNISFLSLIETAFSVDLTFSTDQFASFGEIGQDFVFTLTGRFADIQTPVSAPVTSTVLILFAWMFIRRFREAATGLDA